MDHLGWMAQLVGSSSNTPKGRRFDSQSGHIARLWVRSPVKMHTSEPINVSLISMSLPLALSLKSIKTSPQVRIKKIYGLTRTISRRGDYR